MADITLATFSDAVAAPSATFNENLYKVHASTPASLEVINGWLDTANVTNTNRQIDSSLLQSNAFFVAGEFAANSPIDYFDDVFNTTLNVDGYTSADTTADFIPIPGACGSFYLPWDGDASCVMVTWNVTWLSDGNDANDCAPIRFGWKTGSASSFTFVSTERRVCPRTIRTEGASVVWRGSKLQHWEGHCRLGVDDGWVDVGLFIASTCLQARVWNRCVRYIALRRT